MLVKLGWKNLWRNKLRTGVMLAAMAFGLIGVILMIGFMNGMVNNMINNAISWQTSHIQVHNPKQLDNPTVEDTISNSEEFLRFLSNQPDIEAYSGRFIVNGMIGTAKSSRGVQINGVNPEKEKMITPIDSGITNGEWLSDKGRNPVLISEKTAKRLRARPGSKVVITFADSSGEVVGAAFRVKGIFKTPSTAFDDRNIYVRINDLQKLANNTGLHEIAIRYQQEKVDGNVDYLLSRVAALKSVTDENVLVRDWKSIQPLLASMISTMATSNAIILGIFVLAMCLGIVNIMLMAVYERKQEFGVLMAVGMQKNQVLTLIIFESAWLGICGGAIGIIVSEVMMLLLGYTGLNLGSMAEGLGAYGIDTLLFPSIAYSDYIFIFTSVVFASVIAAIYPARQVLKLKPVDAMAV
ncbi:ABC transporter permease [Vibrio hannami]|uniref:ABC transporter permease n=1 Tax=Vibrio hannami TaxID=2717094 RepID=UPI00240F003A|nr:FtsX-like permease family protein [Vibrio hannami]MDG3085405.1 ABC transporter permease [Vibrio hannami]